MSQPSIPQPDQTATVQIAYLADTPDRIPLVAEWQHTEWGHLAGARTLEQRKERLQDHLQRVALPTTFVAWQHGQPVGCAGLVANDMELLPEWIPWLASVYVLPEVRRQGIGAKLVERVAAEALQLGYPRLYLYTLDQMHFYQRLGWQISHVRFYRGHDMTVMTRDLIVNRPLTDAALVTAPVESLRGASTSI
jgi:N-acetylglutamate synthase-like GNAT family acetyltransferase